MRIETQNPEVAPLRCPACEHRWVYDLEHPWEGDSYGVECPECEKEITITVDLDIVYKLNLEV